MQIKGKHRGLGLQYVKRYNKAKDGLTAELDVEVVTTRKQAERIFGTEFAALAFGAVIEVPTEDGNEVIHLADSIKASDRFKADKHAIELDGIEVITKPVIQKINPIHKSERVATLVRIPVHIGGNKTLGGKLQNLVNGEDFEIKFTETQKSLPFDKEDEGE